jgi:hypothetical protein
MNHTLRICWLYPDLMSTYGDRGNIIALKKRCEWRGIAVSVNHHTIGSPVSDITSADILFMGGAQDQQQKLVIEDLFKNKKKKMKAIQEKVNNDISGLYICGAYQLLGNYYKAADGTKIPGLGIFDIWTEQPDKKNSRLIGNIVIEQDQTLRSVGFENHGGRTYLGKTAKPFAKVIEGFGNNGTDGTEGIVYKNSIGTYLHGPILPKNPELADWLIKTALEKKYKKNIVLSVLDDRFEKTARQHITARLGVK